MLCDIEALDDISRCCEGADAVVFAAGAGPGSGAERKRTVDYGGAVKLIEAAKKNGIDRYVMRQRASASTAPSEWSEPDASRTTRRSGTPTRRCSRADLSYTIVRPGRAHRRSGTGLVEDRARTSRAGEIPREDVAATLLAVLETPSTVGKTFELVSGDTPIDDAVRGL